VVCDGVRCCTVQQFGFALPHGVGVSIRVSILTRILGMRVIERTTDVVAAAPHDTALRDRADGMPPALE
jgi:hypothetical protein